MSTTGRYLLAFFYIFPWIYIIIIIYLLLLLLFIIIYYIYYYLFINTLFIYYYYLFTIIYLFIYLIHSSRYGFLFFIIFACSRWFPVIRAHVLLKLNLVFRGWLYQVPWLYEHNYINKTKFSFYVLNSLD